MKFQSPLKNLLKISFVFLSLNSLGQDISYLEGLPKVSDIKQKVTGSTPKETYAKQIKSLEILWDLITFNKFDVIPRDLTKQGPSEEQQAKREYELAITDLAVEYLTKNNIKITEESKREFIRHSHNLPSRELEKFLVDNLFSEETRKKYYEAKENSKQEQIVKQGEDEAIKNEKERLAGFLRNGIISIVVGITCFIFFIVMGLKVGKRKIQRRNQFGVEIHKDYSDLVKNEISEGAMSWVGYFALIAGIILIVYGIHSISLWY
jgi:hypothetical protein